MVSKYSRHHYVDVARLLRFSLQAARTPEANKAIDEIVQDFRRLFASDNSRFDSDRFSRAVYLGEGI